MVAQVGQKAPAFSLPGVRSGTKVSLKEFEGRSIVVLYFYPKDMTSGCTKEACSLRDIKPRLAKLGAVVLGVSPDSLDSHRKFTEKENLNFELLADTERKVCEKYGVWVEKSMYGRKYMGVERSTFIIDLKGNIAKVWRKVKVTGHDQDVLNAVRELAGNG